MDTPFPWNPQDGRLAHQPLVIDRGHHPTIFEQSASAVSVIAQTKHEHASVLTSLRCETCEFTE